MPMTEMPIIASSMTTANSTTKISYPTSAASTDQVSQVERRTPTRPVPRSGGNAGNPHYVKSTGSGALGGRTE